MSSYHDPVLLTEVVEWLAVEAGDLIVDMTFGGGGYSRSILDHLGEDGRLVAFDRDSEAVDRAKDLFGDSRLSLHHAPFSQSQGFISLHRASGHDGVCFDLGVSSHQIDEPERGFSFQKDGPLDMRMGEECSQTAADIVNGASVQELTRMFRDYGDERKARGVAKAIERRRNEKPFTRTLDLAEVIEKVVGRVPGRKQKHPATRCFQALRIAVNQEMEELKVGLKGAVDSARSGARIVVVSYHSLEDRLVKNAFRDYAGRCHCPRRQPVCTCNPQEVLKILTKKPLRPSPEEVERNPRSRSAVMRVAEKI